ncbi:NADP-dependent 3-hydroxy acid dehydrogenase YdfG [Umezawaea tangerina]|uniref:NADP-dependent 3-hydroxy acid dehydrogenase YdfG n=1 Tax=Umezawaea tangerina TaxID=84725 RepID=A0A2T0T556_9PSEU|nr:NADP-dependent 3-hydroxy acid dehydrogenase YdfG [Umezawaea tangerina]
MVTGASSGIGAATALALAAGGAKVALFARRGDRLAELADKITADGGRALAVEVDVTSAESVAAGGAAVREAFGRVDLVVNNAGVMLAAPIADVRSDDWARMVDLNVTGALRVIGEFTSDLVAVAAGGGTADLVDISSVGAHAVFADYAVYCATKAAVTHLSANLRVELGPKDVRVTNVEPGFVESELLTHLDRGAAEEVESWIGVAGRLAAEEVADVVAYAVSRARHVNLRQIVVMPTRQV